jgi:hypothetical protein
MIAKVIPTKMRNDQRERNLQDLFVCWNKAPPARALIAGHPRLMAFTGDPKREWEHSAWGYRPRVDIVGDTEDGQRLVIELKLGAKYEPIGLAEVLFHAERLAHPEQRIHPVLVTQYNLWNRVVIQSLRRRAREQIVAYYEVTVVDVDGAPCFWFDAPLDEWHPESPPDAVRAVLQAITDASPDIPWLSDLPYWYKVDETGTYYATCQRCDQRPAVVDVPHLALVPVEGSDTRWIVWAGTPPAIDAASTYWSIDRYWSCSV